MSMFSFVAEVLTSAGQLETQEATMKLQHLSKKVDQLKLEVHEATVSKYTNFLTQLHSTEQLVADVQAIKAEMDDVAGKIENQIKSQLNMSTGEFQALTSQLEDVNCLLVVLEKLVSLQDGLEAVQVAVSAQEYSEAADAIHLVKSLLTQKVYRHESEIRILTAIQEESRLQTESLISQLSDKWKQVIQWSVPGEKGKSKEVRKTELKIHMIGEKVEMLGKLVVGMQKMKILEKKMETFGQILLQNVIEPVITKQQCQVCVDETGTTKILSVIVSDDGEPSVPSPQQMFENLDKVLQFLLTNLLCVDMEENKDVKMYKPRLLMDLLGENIASQALDLAVKQCLIKAIPSSNKELEEFNTVIVLTGEVHKHLEKIGFIKVDNTVLIDYVQNVNVLFANKKCQEIVEKARTLMTTEVHNTVVVSHDKPLGELPPLMEGVGGGGKRQRRDDLAVESPLSGNTFRLPTCHISASIQELMTLAYETLQEASESSSQCAIQLFCAVRNMFELYCSVFPTYHKQSLDTLPQFTALHYNNCMYISHHLMTLGHQFSKKLPTSINATFVDLVPKIRRLGTESFLQQLSKQKAQMSEYLGAANGFLNVSEKETFFATERAVKQVLHQLQHLRKVWHEILPASNYRKAIGGLLNVVIVEVTDSIAALEDISADDTKQLSGLIATISDRAPQLFVISGDDKANMIVEVQRNVPKWQRFQELGLILNASLIEIGDRWAAGKGPLALAFSSNEVKQLIRALFQNTERRAAMLAKIK